MDVVRPEFLPDADASREEMEAQQRAVAEAATFVDDFAFDAARVGRPEGPLVAGVDQAFLDDRAVSAVVCVRGDVVVERTFAVTPLEIPYIPGLLSYREGGPIVDALSQLESEPELLFFDGSGRIHFREAGIATHMGVVFDVPAIGVAKNLLCGTPDGDVDGLADGERVPVLANADVTAPDGEVIGYAVQSRQYASGAQSINPLWVSPGHRVSASTAADAVLASTAGYKLPEPTRLADAYADEAKATVE
ncbi:endonuclease V [Halorubellus sp. JP-L1]|uniref:endonuclease V n=1 Tax=Halorubellus sp. JP-L1 TaxID=2715753 RepID=UPI00140B4E32|nr:endonuclease V [Halorubellus sp. JP-L1]NHN42299.1 endonuclease V [Halorubellus sp. JP-L1]